MEPNLEGLRKVYDSFTTPRKPMMDLRDAQWLFFTRTNLLSMEKYVTYCFGMSKMTVVSETKTSGNYFNMKFIEFIEMIGRVAHFKFKDDPEMATLELPQKIEIIMEEVLAIQGIERQEPEVRQLDESESDDEY